MKKRFSGFAAGVLVTVLALLLTVPGLAALTAKTIEVYTGVTLYLDDVQFTPKDANGNPVEVLLHNGTTYLPVRAIGEAYGKDIAWDDATKSAYIGYHQKAEAEFTFPNGDNSVCLYKSSVKAVPGGFECSGFERKYVGFTSDEAVAFKVGAPFYLEGLEMYSGQKIANVTNDWITMCITLESGRKLNFFFSQVDDFYTYLDENDEPWIYFGEKFTVTIPSGAAFVDYSTGTSKTYSSLADMLASSTVDAPDCSITVKDGKITAVLMYMSY